ncbi:hypothetical protein CDL12_06483 [Handroanthus impetiginosus]|uniref:NAB domain-containing protein n=1 Tax=Handroanthus impetiginosus TaxID=429701 RepID=A0A2G9HTG7_9LAMI|nr:hypothetical protein CDL12_06483 [Handroanthus impetiginosus]
MASVFVKFNRKLKRIESRKSHSWWWDSHISPKNSKWLEENLEQMDLYVKRMLKLIEEDADSFAKKAEMYYEKRPELINLVEEFYRMYRSLAERYDHVTGEIRKSIPSDLQSQSSGISDIGSEPPSTMSSPDQQPSRLKSGPRAAGFDVFLGGGTEFYNKEGDELSTVDSESEIDDSSDSAVQNDEEEEGLRQKIIELEVELQKVKEKLQVQEEENNGSYFKKGCDEKCEAHDTIIAKYEEELGVAKEKIRLSEEEISRLMIELQKYDSLGELDLRCQSLEEDLRRAKAGEAEIEELKKTLDALQQKYDILRAEKDDLNENISALSAELSLKDDLIDQMSHHLHQLHMEHVNLIAAAEGARKSADKLRSRIKELEREVERKQNIIVEGAEEKREAIRQLCFSLEHYRNGYHRLREVVVGHKRMAVTAA